MDFSVPGSDSWDTTSNQETFIQIYFPKEDSVSSGKNQKKKRPSDNPVSVFEGQKKKKKKLAVQSISTSNLITDESCYKPRPISFPQDDDFGVKTSSNNLLKSNSIYKISSEVKSKNTKKQVSKKKSCKPKTDAIEFHITESGSIKQKYPKQKSKKLKKHSINSSDNCISEKENLDDAIDDCDEELLREEVKNCDVFKDIEKLMLEAPFLKTLGDSETPNDDFLSEADDWLSDVATSDVLSDVSNDETASDDEGSTKTDPPTKPNSNTAKEGQFDSKTSSVVANMKRNDEWLLVRNINSKEKTKSSTLSKAQEKLKAAKFRCLNEKLYTETGNSAFKYFRENPEEFYDYHCGYSLQVSKWPMNPVDRIISDLQKMDKNTVIADLGCGDAKIVRTLSHTRVHSFDLIALNEHVTACDISKVPLPTESVDVAVFCLSLMGVNLKEYLREAHRILKNGGILKIAEVESRINDLNIFIKHLKCFGFTLENQDLKHKLFVFLDLKKGKKKLKNSELPSLSLRPCLYKKR